MARPWRAAVAVVVLALAVPAVSGCNANLSKQEMIVYFKAGATPAERQAAEQACTGVAPETSPEPPLPGTDPDETGGDDRFLVSRANDKDLALLTECIGRQNGVLGTEIPDDSD